MKLLRLIAIAVTLGCLVCSVILTVVFAFGIALVPHTVENANSINSSFSTSAKFVDSFVSKSGRLPSQEEFTSWKSAQGSGWLQKVNLAASTEISEKLNSSFGSPPKNGYVLSLWRGEWEEYYYSWAKVSTVDGALGLYGSSVGLVLLFAFSSLVSWLAAKKLRAKGNKLPILAAQ